MLSFKQWLLTEAKPIKAPDLTKFIQNLSDAEIATMDVEQILQAYRKFKEPEYGERTNLLSSIDSVKSTLKRLKRPYKRPPSFGSMSKWVRGKPEEWFRDKTSRTILDLYKQETGDVETKYTTDSVSEQMNRLGISFKKAPRKPNQRLRDFLNKHRLVIKTLRMQEVFEYVNKNFTIAEGEPPISYDTLRKTLGIMKIDYKRLFDSKPIIEFLKLHKEEIKQMNLGEIYNLLISNGLEIRRNSLSGLLNRFSMVYAKQWKLSLAKNFLNSQQLFPKVQGMIRPLKKHQNLTSLPAEYEGYIKLNRYWRLYLLGSEYSDPPDVVATSLGISVNEMWDRLEDEFNMLLRAYEDGTIEDYSDDEDPYQGLADQDMERREKEELDRMANTEEEALRDFANFGREEDV